MKVYVQQMGGWNCYAYCAEDVEKPYWDYFKSELWWQIGNHFIKTYDNVNGFEYCAKNFAEHGEDSLRQSLKIRPAPWEKALSWLLPEMEQTGVDWYIHGSTAMALLGMEVAPRGVDIVIPNASDFEKVRDHFYKFAIRPFEKCDNWVMSALGTVFMEANIGFAFQNHSPAPYDMKKLDTVLYQGESVCISTPEMLKQDNESYGRPERVKQIQQWIENKGR